MFAALLNDSSQPCRPLRNVQKFICEDTMNMDRDDNKERSPPLSRQTSDSNISKSSRVSVQLVKKIKSDNRGQTDDLPGTSATIKKFPKLKHLKHRFQSIQARSERPLDSLKLSVSFA